MAGLEHFSWPQRYVFFKENAGAWRILSRDSQWSITNQYKKKDMINQLSQKRLNNDLFFCFKLI